MVGMSRASSPPLENYAAILHGRANVFLDGAWNMRTMWSPMLRLMRRFVSASVVAAAVTAHAQLGHEIAQKHATRAGDRLVALTALRAEGRMFVKDEVLPFSLVAQRPNRLRVESFTPLRRVVQGYDGKAAPWVTNTGVKKGAPQDMSEGETRDFIANADFDGPLVGFAEKGYSVDYAGEEPVEGRTAFKLLVMNQSNDIFILWVDAQNYEVVKRTVFRTFDNQRVAVDTFFKDFRAVGGVLQPHRIETVANGRTLYVMLIDRMEANPAPVPLQTFTRPDGAQP